MDIEKRTVSPQEMYSGMLTVKMNELFVGRLRDAESFGFTVTSDMDIYASIKSHQVVQSNHGISWENILLEGRTAVLEDGSIGVYLHTTSQPGFFRDRGDFEAFKRAVVAKMKEKIDGKSGRIWELK